VDEKIAQQVLDEFLPALEALETQSAAILQFLKDRKIASDKDLAPFLEHAANASSVRWRAARLRMDRLLASVTKAEEAAREKEREAKQKNQEATEDVRAGRGRDADVELTPQGAEISVADSMDKGNRDASSERKGKIEGTKSAESEKPVAGEEDAA
jgi:hypothetical protein